MGLQSPYPLRVGQGDLIDFIQESSDGVCLCHAPTGVGKTLAALLAALPNLQEEGKILYAVNRKNQIPIILKELKMINRKNGTDFKAIAFASKADLCRYPGLRKLSYRELLESCELHRMGGTCPYFNALFSGERRDRKSRSDVTVELEARVLDEMPPPSRVESLARKVEGELGGNPICTYELLKIAAESSQILVGTFWYYFHPVVAQHHLQSLEVQRRNCILICDEAHNLPRFCREAMSHSMTSFRLRYGIRELGRYSATLEEKGLSREGLEDLLTSVSGFFERFQFTASGKHLPRGLVRVFLRGKGLAEFRGPVESLEEAASAVIESKVRQGESPRSHLALAASFLRPFLLEESRSFERFAVMSRNAEGRPVKRLEIRCLDPAPLSSSVIDPGQPAGARSSVLMSGTLVPGGFYRDILGVPSASHREFPNVFPEENRLLLLDESISLDWRSREEGMYGRISDRMGAIRANTPGGCMFFFPSYEVMGSVLKVHGREGLLIEQRASTKRDEAESHLRSGGSVAGVMGASLSEGLDLPGLIKAIAVFGLPLERISDNVKLGMSYYETKYPGKGRDYFYYLPAVTKIVQSIGRAHRRREDKAALYVFDRRFCRGYLKSAPRWWDLEKIRISDLASLVEKTTQFWESPGGPRN